MAVGAGKIFGKFNVETVDINYTICGAGKAQKRQELIYRNW